VDFIEFLSPYIIVLCVASFQNVGFIVKHSMLNSFFLIAKHLILKKISQRRVTVYNVKYVRCHFWRDGDIPHQFHLKLGFDSNLCSVKSLIHTTTVLETFRKMLLGMNENSEFTARASSLESFS